MRTVPDRYRHFTVHNEKEIKGFFGEYFFLSNFYLAPLTYKGRMYPSSEHAYMHSKELDMSEDSYELISSMTCAEVKAWGQTIVLRPDWEDYKFEAMHDILCCKFDQNEDLAKRLIATGDALLEETNCWGDVVWGRDINKGGKNALGNTLSRIRNRLILENHFK